MVIIESFAELVLITKIGFLRKNESVEISFFRIVFKSSSNV